MSSSLMLSLIYQRNHTLLLTIVNEQGVCIGKERHYTKDKLIEAMLDAEMLMQKNDIEFGVHPIGFIGNLQRKK